MKKILFFLLTLFLLLAIGGASYWFFFRTPVETSFENEPLLLEAETSEVKEEEDTVPVPETAVTPVVTPAPTLDTAVLSEARVEDESDLGIVARLLRFGYRVPSAPRTIDTIVIHSSYNALGGDVYSVDKTISEYEQYGVGAHYLIDRAGTIYALVEEKNIAYHAGTSKMTDGRKNVNDFSIGIELIGTLDSGFSDKQYNALNELLADIKSRYTIKSTVGHSDIAPGRKTDPWKFDWKKLK